MWCESFDTLQLDLATPNFPWYPNLLDNLVSKVESTHFTRGLWKACLDGLSGSPFPCLDRKHAITDTRMYECLSTKFAGEPDNEIMTRRGFENIIIDDVTIFSEELMHVPAEDCHQIYTIDFGGLTLRPHKCFDVKLTDWMRMPNGLGSFCMFLWFGNLTLDALNRHGLLFGLDPTLTSNGNGA